jgi:methionyl-tRNA formyltransferase
MDKINFFSQDKTKIEIYPQRSPRDGEIDWSNKAAQIYNFIRAQTLPYPCAFSIINDEQIKIIDSKIVNLKNSSFKDGEIVLHNKKTLVATTDKFLEIGNIYVEGEKYRFEDFVRIKKLWGGIFENKKS